jgi:hypothetical protein
MGTGGTFACIRAREQATRRVQGEAGLREVAGASRPATQGEGRQFLGHPEARSPARRTLRGRGVIAGALAEDRQCYAANDKGKEANTRPGS